MPYASCKDTYFAMNNERVQNAMNSLRQPKNERQTLSPQLTLQLAQLFPKQAGITRLPSLVNLSAS